jgi:hypothetical protein
MGGTFLSYNLSKHCFIYRLVRFAVARVRTLLMRESVVGFAETEGYNVCFWSTEFWE